MTFLDRKFFQPFRLRRGNSTNCPRNKQPMLFQLFPPGVRPIDKVDQPKTVFLKKDGKSNQPETVDHQQNTTSMRKDKIETLAKREKIETVTSFELHLIITLCKCIAVLPEICTVHCFVHYYQQFRQIYTSRC